MDTAAITPEARAFHRARWGKITGSAFACLMSKGRGKGDTWSATGLTYMRELAWQRARAELAADDWWLDRWIQLNVPTSKAMRFGSEMEAAMRIHHASQIGRSFAVPGSVAHRHIADFAASPDGITEDGKLALEIKCPQGGTYAKYFDMLNGAENPVAALLAANADYAWQTQAEIECTGAEAVDFCVCDPLCDRYFFVTIQPDADMVEQMRERIPLANGYINDLAKSMAERNA